MFKSRFYLIGLIALILSFALWNCNTTDAEKNTVLNLTVSDSLSVDKGYYDSIRVDLMDAANLVFRPAVFQGAYVTTENPGGLHVDLGANVPPILHVVITGHRKDGQLLITSITFENGNKSKPSSEFSKTPTGVRIQPEGPVTLSAQGDPLPVSAQVLPVGATANVTWISLDTNTAVIQNGFVIPKKVGNTQVIATVDNTLFKDTLKVNVATLTRPDSVRLSIHSLSLALGASDTVLKAKVYPDSLQARGLAWQSSDNAVATVTASGSVKIIGMGNALIVVNASGFSGVNDTCHVTVTPRVPTQPESLQLNHHTVILFLGEADTLLQAQIFAPQFQSLGAVWSSSDTNVATVSVLGMVKAKTAGRTLISAAITGFAGIFDTCRVTIMAKPTIQPDSVRLKTHTLTLTVGSPDSLLQAKISPDSLNRLGFVWKSNDTTVASVNGAGSIKAISAGKVLITVYPTGFSGVFDTCRVTILPKPITQPDSIRLSLRSMSIFVGAADSTLTARIFPDSLARLGLVWKSSDTTVAKVTAGKVKPIAAGNAFIIAYPTGYPGKVDTCRVAIVVKPLSKPDSVKVSPRTMTLYVGGADSTVTARIIPDSLTRLGLVWTSSDIAVATVSAAGKVKAVAAGNAYIIAYPTGFPGTADTCRVTAKKDVPTLTAGPDRSVIISGQLTFTLKVVQEFGGVAALKWDLDGDNVYDDSVKADTASPKHTYPTAGNFTAHFYVRDGEGNIVTSSLTVHVGSAPLVIITSPAALDTSVNATPITVRYTVNGTAFTRSVGLVAGPNPVVIDSTTSDGRGYDSLMINLDMTPPSSPTFTGTSGSVTASSQPTWQWTSPAGGGGNGTYQIKLDANPVITQTAKSYQPAALTEGSHTLTLQERDAAGNWSTPPATFVWKVDLSAPTIQISAPVASGNYLTKATAVHVAGTASDATGLASITYVLSGATVDSTLATGTTAWAFDMTVKEGATTVKVIAKDLAGRTTSSSITVTSDQTRPKVTLDAIANDVKITSKDIPVAGGATDAGGINTVSYSINSGTPSALTLSAGRFSFTPACPDGDCSVKVLAIDAAGNRDSQTVVIYKRNDVIFVRKNRTGGDGSSWAKAFGELSQVMDGVKTFSGKRIWVSEGSYLPNTSVNVFYADNSAALIGGFKADGSQNSESQRTPFLNISEIVGRANPTLSTVKLIGGGTWDPIDGFTVDGFKITNAVSAGGIYTGEANNLEIRQCQFLNYTSDIPLYITGNGTGTTVKVTNSRFTNNVLSDYAPLHVGGATAIIDSSYFENNVSSGGAISSFGGSIIATNSTFKNDRIVGQEGYFEIKVSSDVAIKIENCRITNGQDGILGGILDYKNNTTLAPP